MDNELIYLLLGVIGVVAAQQGLAKRKIAQQKKKIWKDGYEKTLNIDDKSIDDLVSDENRRIKQRDSKRNKINE